MSPSGRPALNPRRKPLSMCTSDVLCEQNQRPGISILMSGCPIEIGPHLCVRGSCYGKVWFSTPGKLFLVRVHRQAIVRRFSSLPSRVGLSSGANTGFDGARNGLRPLLRHIVFWSVFFSALCRHAYLLNHFFFLCSLGPDVSDVNADCGIFVAV